MPTALRVVLPLTLAALLALPSFGWGQQELRSGRKGATNPAPITSTSVDSDTQALDVFVKGGASGSGGDGAINDGVSSSIKATVFDRTNSNPVATQLVDSNGDPVSVGGGTQYSQGTAATDTDQLTMAGCVRSDTPAVATGVIDGDRARCIVDSTGRLWVHVGVVDGTIAALQSGAWNVGQSGAWTVTANAGTGTFAVSGTTFDGILKDGTGDTTQANVSGGRLHVDGSGVTQPISAASLPLPTGAATAANQDGIIRDGTGDTTQANVSSGRLHVDPNFPTTASTSSVSVRCVNTAGNAFESCGGAGGSGVTHIDNAAFTGGTDDVAPMGALFDATPPTITDGNLGAPRMDSARLLYARPFDGTNLMPMMDAAARSGYHRVTDGTNTAVVATAAPSSGDAGLVVRNINPNLAADNSTNSTSKNPVLPCRANASVPTWTEGNQVPCSTDLSGNTRVTGTITIGTFPDNEPINVAQMNGVAVTMGNGVSGTGVQRVTIASDSTGQIAVASLPNEGQQTMANSISVALASDQSTLPVSMATNQPVGTVAHDAVDSGNPVKVGCHARTTNRAAVADADRADVVCDDNGQLVVTPMAPRDRVVRSGVVTLTNTTETTLVAAGGSGVFRDLTYLKCTNSSATLVRVDLRDATAGTVIDSWALAANGGGFNIPFSVPYTQATANNNWTVQLSGAVTDVRCSAQAVEKN